MKWVLAEHDAGAVSRLSEQAGIHPLIARLMVARGITDAAAALVFLSRDLSSLSDPRALRGMDRAVGRIRQAISSGEPITVYGDYDVDGVTGAALLFLALRELGARIDSYIPDRMTEGYGLNEEALGRIKASGAALVITVDCGISAVNQAAAARALGLDLIITDHHESAAVHWEGQSPAPGVLPEAFAIIHPGLVQPGTSDAVRDGIGGLTGVGVAFKLAQALTDLPAGDERMKQYLDLVTLGTIADIGRITGENRVLVKHGLDILSSEPPRLRPGIAALKQVANLSGKKVSVGTVGYTLAPRINASGRLERADTAFRLMTTDSPDEALHLATMLDRVNRERQAVEEAIWGSARELCLQADMANTGAFILSSDDWHPGVIGIVASRIVEEFYRPAALISVKDGVGKGSARSIPGFDLYQGLSACSDLLLGFGGHKYAAGLTVAEDQIQSLRERLSAAVLEQIGPNGFVRTLSIDAPVTFNDLTFDLLSDIERMAPFGQGNPEPRFGAKGLEVLSLRPVKDNKHLKLRLRQQNGISFDAIAFNKGESLGSRLRTGTQVAAVFTPRINTWNGMTNIQLEIRDIKIEQ
ncbi:MAG: single-stranded-DNA-specific exonuclease RecJ [Nitrospirae bacterium]|nr:single-stranded-DNA-specific exonuclease RecJ [Nitrospirota bacterium]